ncbi:MAG TPA: prolyl oligopeptidase family serine peptidase [Pirellulaceae bacterium]|jgi:alpha-beta hydrolase superfamily lysophospholipase
MKNQLVLIFVFVSAIAFMAPAEEPPAKPAPPKKLALPGEILTIADRPAFIFLPPAEKRTQPQPWIFYAPTLPAYPDEAERWMHEQFLAAGIAVAGIDVGEAYGSPSSHVKFDALYDELITKRNFAPQACLFGRSRGGLWVSSYAIRHPERVSGIIGIYPVFDFRTYPRLAKAAPAYGLTPEQLEARSAELNPIERISILAKSRIPVTIIHGDMDTVVPIQENSAELLRRYQEAGAGDLVNLIIAPGQGHSFWPGFFHEQALVDFAIAKARQ